MARAAVCLAWAGLSVGLIVPALISQAWAGDLQVVVTNVRNARGLIQVGLCPADLFLGENCPLNASASAIPGETIVTVPNVPDGIWAAQVYHDENSNEQVDRDLLGVPTEGIGFSNNAPFRFGPPSFQDARFQMRSGGGRITLRLRYFN